jgi:hypothetical protein
MVDFGYVAEEVSTQWKASSCTEIVCCVPEAHKSYDAGGSMKTVSVGCRDYQEAMPRAQPLYKGEERRGFFEPPPISPV